MKETTKAARATAGRATPSEGLTPEEIAALKETVKERKAAARRARSGDRAGGEADVLAKIAEMPESDRVMAERLHQLIRQTAPDLLPRTWYGMPAYANRDGKIVCFFQSADKFKARYATFGFNDAARLDEGTMWPTSFALTELNAADEATIGALVKKSLG